MRITLIVISVLLLVTGAVWILQGINILPGSFMTGQIRWAYAGIVTALIGGGLLWIALRVGQGLLERDSVASEAILLAPTGPLSDVERGLIPEEEKKMPTKLIVIFGLVALVVLSACGGGATADPESQFAGAWTLVKIEQFDADGELRAPPIEDRVGYIIYDPAGYMGVTIMQPDRRPYASTQRTPEEGLASYSTYSSYFGTFTVNEAEGFLTHHLEGSLNTLGAGSDYKRFYTFSGNRLTLQPPPGENGNKTQLTWEKLPDLPESELTETHRQLFGFYRIESVSRRIVDGDSLPANQYETAFIIYAPSGHMAVHLMRRGRDPYAGTGPTPEEALAAVQTYGSYFGSFSVHEDEDYLVHHRIGNLSPGGDRDRRPASLRVDRHASHPATARRDRQRGPSGAKRAEVGTD